MTSVKTKEKIIKEILHTTVNCAASVNRDNFNFSHASPYYEKQWPLQYSPEIEDSYK